MKKTYIQPELLCVDIRINQVLLTTSGEDIPTDIIDDIPVGGDESLIREFDTFDVADFEEPSDFEY